MPKENSFNTFCGNNCFIRLGDGVQNAVFDTHVCGVSKDEMFERELEPVAPYKQIVIVNNKGNIEIM